MMLRKTLLALPVLAVPLLAAPLLAGQGALAATTTPEINIRVDHGSVYMTKDKQTSTQGFLQIHNDGSTDDVLTGWDCSNADKTALLDKAGKPLTELRIPARQSVTLAPGGDYFALSGLRYPVQRGSIMPCALTFQQAGQVGAFLNEVKPPKQK